MIKSKALIDIITQSIKIANSYNVDDIFNEFTNIVAERYSKKNLDYQLRRMGINSTGDVKNSITDFLMNNINLVPDIDFGGEKNGSKKNYKRQTPENSK